MKQAKTAWVRFVQQAFTQGNNSVSPPIESRRQFLKNTSMAMTGFACAPSLSFFGKTQPKVAIVGGGLAGLTTAWRLKQAGIEATVYEASDRIGGRIFTARDFLGKGYHSEVGGEFISGQHTEIIRLADELGLERTRKPGHLFASQTTLFFDGKKVSMAELVRALAPYQDSIMDDIRSLPKELTWRYASGFHHFDQLSINQYLTSKGIDGWLHKFLCKAFTQEFNTDSSKQSALNFLSKFTSANKGIDLDPSDQIVLENGNQGLCEALADKLKKQVQSQHRLIAAHQRYHDYLLTFETADGKKTKVAADFVVMAIPFNILRKINCTIPFPSRKDKVIEELGYGRSGKLVLSFEQEKLEKAGITGRVHSDQPFANGWVSAKNSKEGKVSLTILAAGTEGRQFSRMTFENVALNSLGSLCKIHPSVRKAFNNQVMGFCWTKHPFSQASTSCYLVGQYSELAGVEWEPVENCFFAGEHCSTHFRGTMNGAAETGSRAARAIIEQYDVDFKNNLAKGDF